MNNNFLMLNFCTEYSSEGSTYKKMSRDACFSTIFHSVLNGRGIIQENKYTLVLYKPGDFLNKKKQNNACFTDRKGIVKHIRVLKSFFPLKYRLKEREDSFKIVLILKGDIIYHKFLLCWVRYLYEYPFNVFLAEANKLKNIPEFKFKSIINLFNLVGATSSVYDFGTNIHAIGEIHYFKHFMTVKEIKDKLNKLKGGKSGVNDIFKIVREIKDLKTLKEEDKTLHSSKYWDSEEEFNNRLELYKENYKIIKRNK